MDKRKGKSTIPAIAILLVAAAFQIVGLVRYSTRLPDDWLGGGLHAATIIGLLSVAGLLAGGGTRSDGNGSGP